MKTKVLSLAASACMFFAFNTKAQITPPATYSPNVMPVSGFETWTETPSNPLTGTTQTEHYLLSECTGYTKHLHTLPCLCNREILLGINIMHVCLLYH